uniref:Uncharacterized protein n=1 Tax=Quercus lobata TaxID=97700 RepID=A0A7N2R2D8_QUELO
MAEGALIKVAEGIIGQLGKLALKEIVLLWGVKGELEKLTNTVSTIEAVILDAEEQQAQNHTIKNWLGKLKDALFEADDLLDDFSTEVLRREVMTRNKKAKEVRIFFSKSNQLAYGLKMGHKIKAIRERLDAIAADRKFHLEERPRETQVTNPIRETDYFVRAETVIGREFDKKVILERLLDSNIEENVSVYSIVGFGGLGKTTLAQLVFNDEEIEKEFERKFWVCVSDDFDVNIIVKKILEYAKGKKLENLERNASINDLQKEIDGKRFLLVLDDVWNDDSEKWDKLKEILLAGARGSRILVTTREEKVAESSKTIETHRLTGLNDEDSWSLFKQKAFKKGQEPKNSKYKEIGMEIVSKCKGVPLAIKTIGSLLYSKKSEEEWLSFKNNEFSKLTCDAFVSSFKFLRLLDLHEIGIRNVPHSIGKLKHLRYLDLSYNRHIKMLPNSITRLQNLETLDLSYCKELTELPKNISKLINLRHLNIDECDSLTHMPRGFGQLTNLHSLARYVLSTDSRCGGELKELHGLNQLRENLTIENLRHKKDAELEYKAVNLKEKQHLKGLTLEWTWTWEVDVGYDEMSVEALEPNQNLKSLELKGYRGVKYPSWLYLLKNLVSLKLVSMKNSQDVLPLHQFPSLKSLWLSFVPSLEYVSLVSESFKLPPLESLHISDCPNLKGWWKRRSDFSEEDEDAADNYGEISTITTKNHSFSRLSQLHISGCPKLSSMPLFPYLEILRLDNSNLRLLERTISMGMISTVSQENPTAAAVAKPTSSARSFSSILAASFTPLSKLKSLGIGMIECSDDHFLQHFTALGRLSLYNYNGDEMELEWQGLRKLQDLELNDHPKLASLPVGLQQATSLRYLAIRFCPSLTILPEWICEIISLQSLHIWYCRNLTSLPALTSLKTLKIWICPNLTSLPALTSLQSLDIWDCPNLTSLPALTSLKTLGIRTCPILVESCKSQDWIARIENLNLEEDSEQTWSFTKIFGRCSGSTSQ